MQQCPNCGHHNRTGVVFCESCGASLIGKLPFDTRALDSTSEEERAQLGLDGSVLTDVAIQGASMIAPGMALRFEIEGSPDPIVVEPKTETIFGRRDPATGAVPDVDLTPFAGYRMGVSRRHAALRLGEAQMLELWDLGSSNGTFLNGQRLNAHRPYRIQDGDEIRLGQMVIKVFFSLKPLTEPKPDAQDHVQDVVDTPPQAADDVLAATAPPNEPESGAMPGTAPLKPFKRQPPTTTDSASPGTSPPDKPDVDQSTLDDKQKRD